MSLRVSMCSYQFAPSTRCAVQMCVGRKTSYGVSIPPLIDRDVERLLQRVAQSSERFEERVNTQLAGIEKRLKTQEQSTAQVAESFVKIQAIAKHSKWILGLVLPLALTAIGGLIKNYQSNIESQMSAHAQRTQLLEDRMRKQELSLEALRVGIDAQSVMIKEVRDTLKEMSKPKVAKKKWRRKR